VTVAQWEAATAVLLVAVLIAAVAWNVLRDLPANATPGDAP
jgi:hypothetical protein